MFERIIQPRFSETDALGHISNTTIPVWFEDARQPVFKIFTPTLDIQTWPLILARFEIDFTAQIYYGEEVLVKTGISKIGNSSLSIYQEAWQRDKLAAKGSTTLVHFDYEAQKASPITDAQRANLTAHIFQ